MSHSSSPLLNPSRDALAPRFYAPSLRAAILPHTRSSPQHTTPDVRAVDNATYHFANLWEGMQPPERVGLYAYARRILRMRAQDARKAREANRASAEASIAQDPRIVRARRAVIMRRFVDVVAPHLAPLPPSLTPGLTTVATMDRAIVWGAMQTLGVRLIPHDVRSTARALYRATITDPVRLDRGMLINVDTYSTVIRYASRGQVETAVRARRARSLRVRDDELRPAAGLYASWSAARRAALPELVRNWLSSSARGMDPTCARAMGEYLAPLLPPLADSLGHCAMQGRFVDAIRHYPDATPAGRAHNIGAWYLSSDHMTAMYSAMHALIEGGARNAPNPALRAFATDPRAFAWVANNCRRPARMRRLIGAAPSTSAPRVRFSGTITPETVAAWPLRSRDGYHDGARLTASPSVRLVGIEVELCARAPGNSLPLPTGWSLESDSSIVPKTGEAGFEAISPPASWSETRATASAWAARLHADGLRPRGGYERVCGLHLTSSIPSAQVQTLRRMFQRMGHAGVYGAFTGRLSETSRGFASPDGSGKYQPVNLRRHSRDGALGLIELRAFTCAISTPGALERRIALAHLLFALTNAGCDWDTATTATNFLPEGEAADHILTDPAWADTIAHWKVRAGASASASASDDSQEAVA